MKEIFRHSGAGTLDFRESGCVFVVLVESGRIHLRNEEYHPAFQGQTAVFRSPMEMNISTGGEVTGIRIHGAAALSMAELLYSVQIIPEELSGEIKRLVQRLRQASGNPAESSSAAYSILCRIAETQNNVLENRPPFISSVISFIDENYASVTGVEELALSVPVNKSYLIRAFKKETGITPGRYLTAVRISHAKRFLTNHGLTLEMVAGLCGFSSADYFCRIYKKETGETPASFKRRNPVVLEREQTAEQAELFLV